MLQLSHSHTLMHAGHTHARTRACLPAISVQVAVEVGAAGVFRLGVSFQGAASDVIESPSLGPNRVMPPFTPSTRGSFTGITTS
jgi:hypothetical protein